jgi:hypothetical protein
VLNHDRRFAINIFFQAVTRRFFERLFPTTVSKSFEVLVHDVCRRDRVNNGLPEMLEFRITVVDGASKVRVALVHQKVLGEVD